MKKVESVLHILMGFAFDGLTYDPEKDFARLKTSLEKVRWLMLNPLGKWWTLRELADQTGSSEAGVSARVRDLRKPKNGGLIVENERMTGGLWRYRVVHWVQPDPPKEGSELEAGGDQ